MWTTVSASELRFHFGRIFAILPAISDIGANSGLYYYAMASRTLWEIRGKRKDASEVAQVRKYLKDGVAIRSEWHELARLEGHTSDIETLALSPDGKQLASSSNDTTVRVWDVATGKLLTTIPWDREAERSALEKLKLEGFERRKQTTEQWQKRQQRDAGQRHQRGQP